MLHVYIHLSNVFPSYAVDITHGINISHTTAMISQLIN